MSIEENYVKIEHVYLTEEKCIQLIEQELDSFFEIRLKLIYSICDSYIKGSIKNSDGIINFLDPSNDEVRAFTETMIYKLNSIINANFPKDSIYSNIYTTNQYHINIEDSIDKFIKTEKVLNLCERILDKSLSNIFETYCKSGILNHFLVIQTYLKKSLAAIV
ncbi:MULTISPECIES: hypothetical protein [unclassified Clostridium]|uniref:hypothetical protein n=1 Tax=unclassified Clostridium TaxID=2614128 RepID=UPI000297D8DE|nr:MULTISPECIES: hypothetical protein [unclassified Clostridium]EKQ57392.1 MAG: hypothetical protein A370_00963 [Clostridium sp. Maddingley MBC34-26]